MESGRILFELFLMFAAAKLSGEVFERLRQPALVGEVLVGVLLGPHVLGWVQVGPVEDTVASVGVVLLMLLVGLRTKAADLVHVGWTAAIVAILGVILPFAAGYWFTAGLGGRTGNEALFIGTALVATSVGITARVLADVGMLDLRPSRIILAAAVIDDVLGLIVLSIVEGTTTAGHGLGRAAFVAGVAVAFVAIQLLVVPRLVTRHYALLERLRIPDPGFTAVLIVMLGLSTLAESIGLAAIVGAFFAGMAFAGTPDARLFAGKAKPLHDWLVPYFFVVMGTRVDIGLFTQAEVLVPGVALVALAVITKLVACGLGALREGWRCALAVGVGMVPRGEVGIIVASVGATAGILSPEGYAIIILMSLVTTLIVPPVVPPVFRAFACRIPRS